MVILYSKERKHCYLFPIFTSFFEPFMWHLTKNGRSIHVKSGRIRISIRYGDKITRWEPYFFLLPHLFSHGEHAYWNLHLWSWIHYCTIISMTWSAIIFLTLRSAQDLLHLPSLRQLIHQLIQIPDLLCQRILDFLYTIPADYPGDEVCIGM